MIALHLHVKMNSVISPGWMRVGCIFGSRWPLSFLVAHGFNFVPGIFDGQVVQVDQTQDAAYRVSSLLKRAGPICRMLKCLI